MKWIKINQRTGEVATRNCNSFEAHDYIADDFRIINKSWISNEWILTKDDHEIGRFKTLKSAKAFAEEQ